MPIRNKLDCLATDSAVEPLARADRDRACRGLVIVGTDTGVGKTQVAAAIVRLLFSQGLAVGAYKPVCSGARFASSPAAAAGTSAGSKEVARSHASPEPSWDDIEQLFTALDERFPRERICPQRFLAPAAAPVAARLEGRAVDRELLCHGAAWWLSRVEALIVEGAGGLLSPLCDPLERPRDEARPAPETANEPSPAGRFDDVPKAGDHIGTLAAKLGFPLLIVARRGLGTINHTLLTVEAARSRGLNVAGIVLNDAAPADVTDVSRETNRAELERRLAVPVLAETDYEAEPRLLQLPALLTIDWFSLMRSRGSQGESSPEGGAHFLEQSS